MGTIIAVVMILGIAYAIYSAINKDKPSSNGKGGGGERQIHRKE